MVFQDNTVVACSETCSFQGVLGALSGSDLLEWTILSLFKCFDCFLDVLTSFVPSVGQQREKVSGVYC